MKLLILIVAISLSTAACFAKGGLPTVADTKAFQTIEIADHPPCISESAATRDRWGLMDRTGKVTPLPLCRIIKSGPFGWIAAVVTNPDRTQFERKLIGPKGQIIPKTDTIEVVNFLTENRAPVRCTYDAENQTNIPFNNRKRFSYCTETGEVLKARFNQVSAFSDKVAAVRIGQSVGFIGLDGQFLPDSKLVECQFKEGLSQGYLAAYVNGLWGYLDTHGNWLVKPIFDSAEPFKNDFAQVGIHNSTPTIKPKPYNLTYIDKSGKLFTQRFHSTQPFEGDYAEASILSNEQNSRPLWGLIDRSGKWALEPKYSAFGRPIGSTRLIYDKERVGFFSNGKIVVPPKYALIGQFSEGLASFRSPDSKKIGYIDQEGKIVIPPQFAFACDFSEGYAAVGYPPMKTGEKSKMGFINRKGVMMIAPKFGGSALWHAEFNPSLMKFRDGICLIPDRPFVTGKDGEGKWGYINKAGQWIGPSAITRGDPFYMGRALIRYYPRSSKK